MKFKSILVLLAVSISSLAFAQEAKKSGPPAGNAIVGDTYGSAVTTESKVISVDKLSKKLNLL